MGYYTRYQGSVTGPQELLDKFVEDANGGDTFGDYDFRLDDWFGGNLLGGDSIKWYGWKQDLESLSAKYPHLLFALEGEGEESGDIWKAWARNGNVVKVEAKIVFDEPDLETVLPAPDVEEALAKIRAEKRAAIQAQIEKLQSELESV